MKARVLLASAIGMLLAACGQRQAEVQPSFGHDIYDARCGLCHGGNREGRPGMYPPLAGSAFVDGPPERLAAVILDGVEGPLDGYNAVMPGWRDYMRDSEIAAVLTWLRQADGKPGVTAVEVTEVRAATQARSTFWNAEDLRNFRVP